MKVLNVLWGFSTGGVGKCFLTYNRIPLMDSTIDIRSVCIHIGNSNADLKILFENGIKIIGIKNRWDLSWLPILKANYREYNPDLSFVHGFNGPIIALLIRLVYHIRVPFLCSYHGEYHPPTFFKRLMEPIYNSLTKLIYRHYALGIVGVAEHNRRFLCSKGIPSHKISIIHNGIPDLSKGESLKVLHPFVNNEVIIGFIGRLDPIKGIELLIDTVETLNRTNFKFGVLIVGDGPLRNTLSDKVQYIGLSNKVFFAGYQSNIPQWLDTFDIYVQPSFFENHSISILEAMRSGKAIVASSIGGNPESLEDKKEGILFAPGDKKAFLDALLYLLENQSARNNLGMMARKRYESEFTEVKMISKLASFINSFKDNLS